MTRGLRIPISGQTRTLTLGSWANGLWASLWVALLAWVLHAEADAGTRLALTGILGVLIVLRSGMAFLWAWHATRRGAWSAVAGPVLPVLAMWAAVALR